MFWFVCGVVCCCVVVGFRFVFGGFWGVLIGYRMVFFCMIIICNVFIGYFR